MSLGDHLRELRNRLIISIVAVVLGGVVGWLAYDWLLTTLSEPLLALEPTARRRPGAAELRRCHDRLLAQAQRRALRRRPHRQPGLALPGLGVHRPGPDPAGEAHLAGVRRRRGAAVPRRLLPRLRGCCPRPWRCCSASPRTGASNLQNVSDYLDFVTRFILAFGLAFLLPVFLVALNVGARAAGAGDAQGLARRRSCCIFVFSAMMTPTPDAWTMLAARVPDGRPVLRRGRRRRAHRPPPAPERARLVRAVRRRGEPACSVRP